MINFLIKDLAHFSGIKPHTIRMWEQRFSILKPKRSGSLRRIYTIEELSTFLGVTLLTESGFRVSQVARMTPEEKAQILTKIERLQQDRCLINELIICMAQLDMDHFEATLNRHIATTGIHQTIERVIIPFAEKAGLILGPEHHRFPEHICLAKEVIKRKLQRGLDELSPEKRGNESILFFLPPGEGQELVLLYLTYLAKRAGHKTIYAGPHTSTDTLKKIAEANPLFMLVTHLVERRSNPELVHFVAGLKESLPGTCFITSGCRLPLPEKPGYYQHLNTPHELPNLLSA